MREVLSDALAIYQGHKAALSTTSAVTGKVDTNGAQNMLAILNAGLCSGASLVVKLQHTGLSTNLTDEAAGSWADVASGAFATITAANDNALYVGEAKAEGLKRFVRLKAINASGSAVFSTEIVLGLPKSTPLAVNVPVFSV